MFCSSADSDSLLISTPCGGCGFLVRLSFPLPSPPVILPPASLLPLPLPGVLTSNRAETPEPLPDAEESTEREETEKGECEGAEEGSLANGEKKREVEGGVQGRARREGEERSWDSCFSLFPPRGSSFRAMECTPVTLIPVCFLPKKILWQVEGEA